ncbi:MAG: hypothetical protein JXB13_20585 [Phycisphaerae bacterium]|nr:hypothetical protein [Phycisphaerae bacterium]
MKPVVLKTITAQMLLFTPSVVFLGGGIVLLWLAMLEPKPGRHAWFLSLAGDATTALGDTGYEIGWQPDGSAYYSITTFRRRSRNGEGSKSIMVDVVRDVIACAFEDGWILAETPGVWMWIDTRSGESHETTKDPSSAPVDENLAGRLLRALGPPRLSHRYSLLVLAVLSLLMGAMALVVCIRPKRHPSSFWVRGAKKTGSRQAT